MQEIGWMEGFVCAWNPHSSLGMRAKVMSKLKTKRTVALDLVRAQESIEKTAFSKGCGVD